MQIPSVAPRNLHSNHYNQGCTATITINQSQGYISRSQVCLGYVCALILDADGSALLCSQCLSPL